jgi:hypothetical protein
VIKEIRNFKHELAKNDPWTKGRPMGVKKITHYEELMRKAAGAKVNMPGHVRAAISWNYLCTMNGDRYSQKIVDGMKVVVCQLKNTPLEMTSVAYPVDQLRLPEWFKELPFDEKSMMRSLIDDKIENLIGVLDWDVGSDSDIGSTFNTLFSFS